MWVVYHLTSVPHCPVRELKKEKTLKLASCLNFNIFNVWIALLFLPGVGKNGLADDFSMSHNMATSKSCDFR